MLEDAINAIDTYMKNNGSVGWYEDQFKSSWLTIENALNDLSIDPTNQIQGLVELQTLLDAEIERFTRSPNYVHIKLLVNIYQEVSNDDVVRSYIRRNAALTIQTAFRRHQAQKNFSIHRLNEDEMTDHWAFFVGNDPTITMPERRKSPQPFALVATSCMRAVKIACDIAGTDTTYIPKIYLVDNCSQVFKLWKRIKMLFKISDTLTDFQTNYQKTFNNVIAPLVVPTDVVLSTTKEKLFIDNYYSQEGLTFLNCVIQKYTYERVKRIISSASIICQNWCDERTFLAIKKICTKLEFDRIYAYPSNIFADLAQATKVPADNIRQLLRNIAILEPYLAIHTGLTPAGTPEGVCDVGLDNINEFDQIENALLRGLRIESFRPGYVPPQDVDGKAGKMPADDPIGGGGCGCHRGGKKKKKKKKGKR